MHLYKGTQIQRYQHGVTEPCCKKRAGPTRGPALLCWYIGNISPYYPPLKKRGIFSSYTLSTPAMWWRTPERYQKVVGSALKIIHLASSAHNFKHWPRHQGERGERGEREDGGTISELKNSFQNFWNSAFDKVWQMC